MRAKLSDVLPEVRNRYFDSAEQARVLFERRRPGDYATFACSLTCPTSLENEPDQT